MRLPGMLVVALVLAAGQVRAQEPPVRAPLTEAADPTTTGVPESSELVRPRPSLRGRLANWRPIRGWLSRTSAPGDQEPVALPLPEIPQPPAEGDGGPAPPIPAGPPEGESAANPPAPTNSAAGNAGGPAEDGRGSEPISGNPAAVNIIAGTGALGRALGIDRDSGVRLGGLWLGDASGVLSGGQSPGRWGLNSLTIVDLNFDGEKLLGWKGSSVGTQYLQYTGQFTNSLAGAYPGFDSIEAGPPLTRNELYELWFRQALFDDRLIFRIGKSVPTYDFNNVVRPVPVGDPSAAIPAVTALAYTPIFVNPTMLGVIPGYYNSATGITTTLAPTKSTYLNYGFYDGNLAIGHQTGFSGPRFDGYYFHIGEFGFSYRRGPERKPGNFGVGVWGQTGKLKDLAGGTTDGAVGVYYHGR